MPLVGTISKKTIENYYNTVQELQKKCESCGIFEGKTVDDIFAYIVYRDYTTADGPAMVAIARYSNTYVVYPPKYLSGKQWCVLEFFLRELKPDDTIVCFNTETFENIQKYRCGKEIKVQLV